MTQQRFFFFFFFFFFQEINFSSEKDGLFKRDHVFIKSFFWGFFAEGGVLVTYTLMIRTEQSVSSSFDAGSVVEHLKCAELLLDDSESAVLHLRVASSREEQRKRAIEIRSLLRRAETSLSSAGALSGSADSFLGGAARERIKFLRSRATRISDSLEQALEAWELPMDANTRAIADVVQQQQLQQLQQQQEQIDHESFNRFLVEERQKDLKKVEGDVQTIMVRQKLFICLLACLFVYWFVCFFGFIC